MSQSVRILVDLDERLAKGEHVGVGVLQFLVDGNQGVQP